MHTILLQSKNIPSIVHMYKELYGENNTKIVFQPSNRFCLKLENGTLLDGLDTVIRFLSRNMSDEERIKMLGFANSNCSTEAQVDYWTTKMYSIPSKTRDVIINDMSKHFSNESNFFIGEQLSLIDIYLILALYDNPKMLNELKKTEKKNFVENLINNPALTNFVKNFLKGMVTETPKNENGPKKFTLPELPSAVYESVVTRFPPEASGYLHIGHAKAAILNQLYKEKYNGKLVMRFDDTNPSKENDHFEKIILEDIKLLGLTPDSYTRTSDHFKIIMDYARQMILSGDAFCDDTPADVMKQERSAKIASKCRDNSIEQNIKIWEEMIKGSELGKKYCLRAKIDFQSPNGCMRDPTIYRCKDEYHVVTKNKFKCYPTYDFACPIVDSIENITHALRTTEYVDRDVQYYWFIQKMKLRKPIICSFSRLNLKYTLLSKRKLTWMVNNGIVNGWNDPRLPTVRGLIRRGMELDALKSFIVSQGFSKNVNNMEQEKIWGLNKQILETKAYRYCALNSDSLVETEIINFKDCQKELTCDIPLIGSNPDAGSKKWFYYSRILLERDDVNQMKQNDKITLVSWGNAIVKDINRTSDNILKKLYLELIPQDMNYKGTLKVTWLPADHTKTTKLNVIFYEHILKKPFLKEFDNFEDFVNRDSETVIPMIGEQEMSHIKVGEKIQILRKGFFICDHISTGPNSVISLINIPDGTKSSPNAKPALSNGENRPATLLKNVSSEFMAMQENEIEKAIKDQGDKIRALKADKTVSKDIIKNEVDKLLALKKVHEMKITRNHKNDKSLVTESGDKDSSTKENEQSLELYNNITIQGDKVRKLKSSKAEKNLIDKEVKILLALKDTYKKCTGMEYKPKTTVNNPTPKSNTQKPKNTPTKLKDMTTPSSKKITKLGLTFKKKENFSQWYSELIVKGGLIEYHDIGGCYVLRPQAYSIWERLKTYMDNEFTKRGVKNCYFPIFVSKSALAKEKEHIADFSPEVAWVTKSGDSNLQEPIALRPTSETVMYPTYAKWIQSHRDLPLKLNQWCNVVRWEFKHPTPFLRSREFLWQEGHTAFASKEQSIIEVYDMLDIYKRTYEELLAVPVIKGKKTEKEKFSGGEFTTTVEAYIPNSGRGIQAATSHHLGQNFSKMFEIAFEDPITLQKEYAYQNSWGFTTRSIGVSIMIHSDDRGLVIPPRVADTQIVIIPCGITSSLDEIKKQQLFAYCKRLDEQLNDRNIRSVLDTRDNLSPGWKFNDWELKGTPIRVEVGPKEMESNKFVICRRDTLEKVVYDDSTTFSKVCGDMLDVIQTNLLEKARNNLIENTVLVDDWGRFISELSKGKLLLAPFCLDINCETQIKDESSIEDDMMKDEPSEPSLSATMGAKTLCIPFDQPKELCSNSKCINPKCSRIAQTYVLFGRSY